MITKTHIMIDIETLSNVSRPVITQIGAVAFNMNGELLDDLEVKISIDSNLKIGRSITESTLSFWAHQNQTNIDVNFSGHRINLKGALEYLADFMGGVDSPCDYIIWGNGPSFDMTHLTTAYQDFGMEIPWKFWNERCVRTMNDLYYQFSNEESPHISFDGVRHNALDDCKYQIKIVTNAFKLIS